MPFTTTQVIPDDWAARHQPVTEGAMGATCTITVPDPNQPGGWDPDTGPTPAGTITLYDGPCRVQPYQHRSTGVDDAAGQLVIDRAVLVAIEHSAPEIPAGDDGATVTITAVDANGDPELVGRHLRVASVGYSSLHWERDLVCVDDLTNQPDQEA